MDRTIRVTGKGRLQVKPDRIRLIMKLKGVEETYEETLKQSTAETEILKDAFEKLGFKRNDLKTLSFDIDTKYESYRDEHRDWKERFIGYEFKHTLKVEFDVDNELLGKALYTLAHCGVKPEFNIMYTIKDPESAKNQLLYKAVADSKEKARVLTKAAGVKLGDIVTIDYSWGEVEFSVRPMEKLMDSCVSQQEQNCNSYDIDIEPDDIDISDTVTVIWSIH